jgi:hypothetical protein
MLNEKMLTFLSDKMPAKKVTIIKQKMELGKIRKLFFKFNFFGEAFSHLNRNAFLTQHKIFDFFYPI